MANSLWQGPMYSTGRWRPKRQLNLASAQRLRCVRPSNEQTGPCHVAARTASKLLRRRSLATPDRPWLAELFNRVTQSAAQTHRGWPWRMRHTLFKPPLHRNPSHEAACRRYPGVRQRSNIGPKLSSSYIHVHLLGLLWTVLWTYEYGWACWHGQLNRVNCEHKYQPR